MEIEKSLAKNFAEDHPAEAARVIEELMADEAAAYLDELPARAAAEVLQKVVLPSAAECLAQLSPARFGQVVAALPLDRDAMARDLGFATVSPSALDAVMDRDFAIEFVSCCAQLQAHLARVAEDLVHFASPEYGFVKLPEAFTTGSSLMPQKKNPDALELIRGKAARVDGDLVRLLVLLKGLPAGYQKDLQEDKEAVFDASDTATGSVAILTGVVAGLVPQREAMRAAASLPAIPAWKAAPKARSGR